MTRSSLEITLGPPGPLDWREVFGRSAPVEMELGFGKARFLIRESLARPEVDFFGVELSRKWYREGKRRMEKAGPPPNLRVLHAEAVDFLTRFVGDDSLRVLHVYYPDPWPKKRHRKRRFVGEPLLIQAERVLEPGGELRIVTDHAEYADCIAADLSRRPALRELPWEQGEEALTHFEAKYRIQGRLSHRFRRVWEGP